MTFGALLRQARIRANLTQQELAERTGYSVSLVRKIEGDQRRATIQTVHRLATVLGVGTHERIALLVASGHATGAAVSTPILPIAPTPLIGREAALAEVVAMVRQHYGRLVALLGPPGVGKTRLALATAAALAQDFDDGVWWIPLAPLQTPTLVMPTMVRLLGGTPAVGVTPLEQLVRRISQRDLLLLLDNCEHVLPEMAAPLAALLEACSRLVIVVTSRVPLRLRAEQRYEVRPLALPADEFTRASMRKLPSTPLLHGIPSEQADPHAMAVIPSVQLFVERATAVIPSFTLTTQSATTIAAIVRRLDGLPLAIELAAAQLDRLSIEAMLEYLQQHSDFSNEGPYDLPDRQRTLHAAIRWSYGLLSRPARMAFTHLGVFVGGCTAEAAQALACDEWLKPLQEAGMLVAEQGRWRLLETLRAFARDQLVADSSSEAVHRAHARYFCDLAERAEAGLLVATQANWLAQLDADLNNIRAALTWSIHADVELALRMSSALYTYWTIRTISGEGLAWMQQALDRGDQRRAIESSQPISNRWRAKALHYAGYMCFNLGDREVALTYVLESIALYDSADPSVEYAAALNTLGLIQRMRGQFEIAEQCHRTALTLFERFAVAPGIARSMNNLGLVLMAFRQDAAAYAQFRAAVGRWRRLGNLERVANASIYQAMAANLIGQHDHAIELATAALSIHIEYQNIGGAAEAERVIGQSYRLLGDHRQALDHLRVAVYSLREWLGISSVTIAECEYLAEVALADGDGERGVRWLAACDAWRAEAQRPTHADPQARYWYQGSLATVRARIGEARWRRAWDGGLGLSAEEMIAEMLEIV